MVWIDEWDEVKRRSNLSKHGVEILSICDFDWERATVVPDVGHTEERWIATGFIGLRLYVSDQLLLQFCNPRSAAREQVAAFWLAYTERETGDPT